MPAESQLADLYQQILSSIDEDPSRDGLLRTPLRAAKAILHATRGYTEDPIQIANEALFDSDNDEMVIVKDIEFYSLCEHHLVPFFGKCHVGYVPNGKVLGLSKVARIVDVYAHRLQIQENFTMQVANALQEVTKAQGVAVVMEAQHLCMMMRGVQKQNSVTTTSCNLGIFRSDARTRSEFLTLIK